MSSVVKRVIAGVLMLAGAASAAAQAEAGQDRDRVRATELVNLVVSDGVLHAAMSQAADGMLQVVLVASKQQGREPSADDRERLRKGLAGVLVDVLPPAMWRDAFVDLYMKHFTPDEVGGLLEFFRSAVGAKLLASQATLMTEGSAIGRSLALSHAGELQQGVLAMLEKLSPPGSALTAPSGPRPVGGDIRPPTKLRDVQPLYPAIARASKVQGAVVLDAVIDVDGSVASATAVSGPELLRPAAVDAVRQWVFSVTTYEGKPTQVRMTVTVTFALN